MLPKSSTGRSLQVKGRRICFVQLPAFDRPRLRANDARGLPSFESFEHPMSSNRVQKKAGNLFSRFPVRPRPSFLDCPAKGNPLPKIRVLGSCRKSASRRRIFFFDRPALSNLVTQRTPLMNEHCPENAAPFQPPALPGIDVPSGGQMARLRPTHRISVGSDEGAAPGNDLYVSMQPAD